MPPPRLNDYGKGKDPTPSAAASQSALDLPIGVAPGDVAPLVVDFFALGERDLDLRPSVLPVEPRRDEREALLADLADQRRDLALVEEQLAVAIRFVVVDVPLRVLGDVRAD